ncbi:MAG: hypothetical protein HOZ81_50525 [Streptomyces sp.]|nr:hypothetical protein [Streptomyces sp.]NUS24411.1 hypothetical protein [Streptomyces sp.]
MGSDMVLGIATTALGVLSAVLVAWVARPREPRTPPEPRPVAGEGLSVSPEIWRDLSGRISGLEGEVRELKDLVVQQGERVSFLERLLRTAMRIVRAQSRTLRKARLPDEPIPAVLMPYSID